MGSYNFKWEHPAEDVHVTGTFDNWTKSIKLEKEGGVFQKTINFKSPAEKVYYKYVVDGNWIVNESLPVEPDHEGNINNFLTIADYTPVSAAVVNTVAPGSTTLNMAGQQPIESRGEIPTPSGIPGGFPITPGTEQDKSFSVNPLPAAAGAINPIKLAPGEEIPKDLKTQSTNEYVKYDKESYEKADTLAGIDVNLPPASETTIPETGFAVAKDTKPTDATISTVGEGATTTTLAGMVPKEPKQPLVPAIVKESQEKANVSPEASAEPKEVAEKLKVEQELKEKVPEVSASSTGTAGFGTEKTAEPTTLAASAAAAGAAITSAALVAKDTLTEKATPALQQATELANKNLPETVKEKLPVQVQETLAGKAKEETREEIAPEIPEEVKKSIIAANKEPEAAANSAAVEEKKAVEKELLQEAKKIPAANESKGNGIKKDSPAPALTTHAVTTPATGSLGHGNGSSSKPIEAAPTTTSETKKKHRISGFFSKLKHKFSDKE